MAEPVTEPESPAGLRRSMSQPTVKLGTFKGVFLPCLQNILGVILFLRLTWITGQAGVIASTAIVVICATSTLTTALSLSAVATNGRVQAGGPYFVISRNLGPEVGTAVGLLFYLGTTIAASMYVLGATEAIFDGFTVVGDNANWEMRNGLTGVVLMTVLALTVSVGVKQVNAAASFFLGVVLLSVACLLIGGVAFAADSWRGSLRSSDRKLFDNMFPNFTEDKETGVRPSFQSLLAMFYPSVTGIMAGTNRSAILESPSKSIPSGTLGAITITTVLYLAVIWLFGCSIDHDVLVKKKLVVAFVAWPSMYVVKFGIIMSSIGAALQSLVGAPRLLQAIAADGTIPSLKRFVMWTWKKRRHSSEPDEEPPDEENTMKKVRSGNRLSKLSADAPNSWRRKRRPSMDFLPSFRRAGSKPLELLSSSERPSVLEADGSLLEEAPTSAPEMSPTTSSSAEEELAPELRRTTTTVKKKKKKKKKTSDVAPQVLVVTWFIAAVPCLAGNLDYITPVVTMFFLLMYATVNLSCFLLGYLKSPGFRPSFKSFHWSTALFGFCLCIALMYAILWYLALTVMVFAAAVAILVSRSSVTKDWGDAGAGLWFQLARDGLLALSAREALVNKGCVHAKNFRPQILVLVELEEGTNRLLKPELLALAGLLKKGRGLLVAHSLLESKDDDQVHRGNLVEEASKSLEKHLEDLGIKDAFPRAIVYRHSFFAEHRYEALLGTTQSCGIGALQPNTVLLGWPKAPVSPHYIELLRDVSATRKALIVLKGGSELCETVVIPKGDSFEVANDEPLGTRYIDVWWVVPDGGLLLLLPWILRKSKAFGGRCKLRLFAVMTGLQAHDWNREHGGAEAIFKESSLLHLADEREACEAVLLERFAEHVRSLLDDVRIQAEVHAIAGLDFVYTTAHVYRDTLTHRKRMTIGQQLDMQRTHKHSKRYHNAGTPHSLRHSSPVSLLEHHGTTPRHGGQNMRHSAPAVVEPRGQSSSPVADEEKNFVEEGGTEFEGNTTPRYAPPAASALASPTPADLEAIKAFGFELNRKIRLHSQSAELVVTNLPYMTHMSPTFFAEYVDAMTKNLPAVMLVRGSGQEVVTKYG